MSPAEPMITAHLSPALEAFFEAADDEETRAKVLKCSNFKLSVKQGHDYIFRSYTNPDHWVVIVNVFRVGLVRIFGEVAYVRRLSRGGNA